VQKKKFPGKDPEIVNKTGKSSKPVTEPVEVELVEVVEAGN